MRLGTPRAGLLAVLTAAVAVAGCGGAGVDDGHRAQAQSAAHVFLSLCAQQRGSQVAQVVNGPALDAMMKSGPLLRGCTAVLRLRGSLPAAAFAHARITRVTATGPSATIAVALPGAAGRGSLEAELLGDRWVITNTAFGR